MLSEKEELKEKELKCIHYWLLGDSNKGISLGICKKCNEQKEFNTYFPASLSWKKKKEKEENKKK